MQITIHASVVFIVAFFPPKLACFEGVAQNWMQMSLTFTKTPNYICQLIAPCGTYSGHIASHKIMVTSYLIGRRYIETTLKNIAVAILSIKVDDVGQHLLPLLGHLPPLGPF